MFDQCATAINQTGNPTLRETDCPRTPPLISVLRPSRLAGWLALGSTCDERLLTTKPTSAIGGISETSFADIVDPSNELLRFLRQRPREASMAVCFPWFRVEACFRNSRVNRPQTPPP
jgi:hypothetical protein